MKKFGEFICKYKIAIIIIAVLLMIPSICGILATKTNYDILTYLPDGIETIEGENILNSDFEMGSFSIVLVQNMSQDDLIKLEDQFRQIDSVGNVIGITDLTGSEIPIEMLPDEVLDKIYSDDGTTMILVTLKDGIGDEKTLSAIQTLRDITDENCKVSGMSATNLDVKDICENEVIIYVVIAVVLCIIILSVALDSFVVPFVLLGNIGIAVIYNMGTNIVFGQISYITKAISAVLQLGVTMDFAIFLYHAYKQEKENYSDNNEAMAVAIANTIKSVVGSSTTTIAGFLALCTMTLTLGADIGLVMAKGVFFGVICTITVLPALILVFDKLITKTAHKEILPKFTGVKNALINHRTIVIAIFVVITPFAIYGYTHTEDYYNLTSGLPDSLLSVSANNDLSEKFGVQSTELILVDKNMPDSEVAKMVDEINNLDGIGFTLSCSKIADDVGMPSEMLPDDITNVFCSDKYQMIIVSSKYENATDDLNNQIAKIDSIIKSYDENSLMAGEGPLMKDLVEIADHDFNSVNFSSIIVIFVLMFFVLQSVSLPVILIVIIEFAIFINLGIPGFTGTKIPFVASISIGTIQLGATIDYAILITNKYVRKRKEGLNKKDAMDYALGTSISSIIVSAMCFFGATFGVGIYSEISMISALCVLMARGAVISMVTVICALPAFLMLFDKIICKTTLGMTKIGKEVEINEKNN